MDIVNLIVKFVVDTGYEATATYIVGVSAIVVAYWQFNKQYRRNKEAKVFEELSNSIQEASTLINKITVDTNSIVTHLANAANNASIPLDQSNNQIAEKEIDRRLKEIADTATKQNELLDTITDSYTTVLTIIKNVERSTIINSDSKKVARYLFYAANDQINLLNPAVSILLSFNVTPPLGDMPNVSPATFNAAKSMIEVINARNGTIENYLQDLEVTLHNNLVRTIYGKAQRSHFSSQHILPSGIIDERVKNSLT